MKMDKTKFAVSTLVNEEKAIKPHPAFDNLMQAINDANLSATERLNIMMALAEYILSK